MPAPANTLAPSLFVDDATKELCRGSLLAFIHNFDPLFKISDFSYRVAQALEIFYSDTQKRDSNPSVLLEAPPQHGKSTQVAVYFPAWLLGINPELRIIIATYSSELASDRCIAIQKIIASPFYQQIFPHTKLPSLRLRLSGKRDIFSFELTDYKGGLKTASIGMPLTGFSADIGIIDDPYKDMASARSYTINQKTFSWYSTVFNTRLSQFGGTVLMLTRWTLDDLGGEFAKKPDCKCLKFQALDSNGRPLVPALFSRLALLHKKSEMSSTDWSAMYQQSPQIIGGNIVKKSWLQTYITLPTKFSKIFITGDTAIKVHESCDYSVFTVWGESENNLYLLDMWRDRVDSPDLKAAAIKLWDKWGPGIGNTPCSTFYVEDKASGSGLIQDLRRNSRIPIKGVPRSKDKFTRIQEILPQIEIGRLHLPLNASWTQTVVDELIFFTGDGKDQHDDIVDTVIDALNIVYLQKKVTMRDVLYSKPRRL